jgi:hypothetical protein
MFWHGEEFSCIEWVCMCSFIDCGHELRVFTYDPVKLPQGVVRADARQILPRKQLFTFENSPSAFTNIFRYKLLLEQGGWWADSDILCLARRLPACRYYWAHQDASQINGAVLRFPPSDPLCRTLFERSLVEAQRLSAWGQLGPALLTSTLPHPAPLGHAGSTKDVYPVHWLETHFFWLPEFKPVVESRIRQSTFLHLWHSVFARMGMDVACKPPAGSFLDSLYTRCSVMPAGQGDEAAARRSIARYLAMDWVPHFWEKRLGRRMHDLHVPLLGEPQRAAIGAPSG